ncbi:MULTISPECIES: hypothetical protein [Streptomyces]|jgi:hypothetical protein|uniref:Secreted protein n=1 Tax=Streptomyces edwardsiae TaxID=3075527 RepID=A0ABU2PXH6_9ACTN|nr:hypothetical protein [Streptomyces sp. DSM 41636]MDT0395430.1 hypothetical protein [Streptomyces sp. DSM 41636]
MNSRGHTLKLTAVSALVVLTLTGFSTGRGHGGGHGDGGGGGCSSSGQNHDSSTSGGSHRDYDDDDDYGADDYGDDDYGSGGADSGESASASELDASVDLVDCASKATPYATVQVTNQNAVDGVFTVTVRFEDTAGAEVVTRSQDVAVPANETVPIRVNVGTDVDVTKVAECDPGLYAPVAG